MNYSITQNGKALDPSKYTIDEKTKTFSINEDNLILDFSNLNNWTFKTGSGCTFKTGPSCTFKTGPSCTFKTGPSCTFDTGYDCTFDTGDDCTFKTGYGCTFDTDSGCTFKTGPSCTFKTGPSCTFKTGSGCAFKTGPSCVVIRRDVFEVIELKEDQPIKLNKYNIKGYTAIKSHVVTIDGKDIELSEESFNNLKKQLCD